MRNDRGISVIFVIAVLLILALLGAEIISVVTTESDVSVQELHSNQAYYIAQGGLEYGLYTTTRSDASWGEYTFSNRALGEGSYTLKTYTSLAGSERRMELESVGGVSAPMAQRKITADIMRGAAVSSIISFDSSSFSEGNVTSLTWSHTTAGTDRIMIVGVSIKNSGETVSSITYGGTPLTSLVPQGNGLDCRVEIWRLIAPALGANNIVLTLSARTRVVAGAISLNGVDQTTPEDAGPVFSPPGNSTTPGVPITTVTNNAWVIDTLATIENITVTVGVSQTERWKSRSGGGPNRINGAGSTYGPNSPAGVVNMSWTLSAAQPWVLGAVALRPSTAPSGSGGIPVTITNIKETY